MGGESKTQALVHFFQFLSVLNFDVGGESKTQALVHFFQFSMFFNDTFVSQVFCGCLQTVKENKIFKCCNPSAGGD